MVIGYRLLKFNGYEEIIISFSSYCPGFSRLQ